MAAPTEKSKIITAFVIDFETGCGECQVSGATQLSAQAIRLDTFEVIGTFSHYIKRYNKKDIAKPKRLKTKYECGEEMYYNWDMMEKYTGITEELLRSEGEDLEVVAQAFIDFIKANTYDVSKMYQPILVGQNILFDEGFLTQILLYTGLWDEFTKLVRGSYDFWGNFQPYFIDTILLSQMASCHKTDVNSWSLGSLCEHYDIELVDAHNAEADVEGTAEILKYHTKRMRNAGDVENDESGIVEQKKTKKREHFKI